VVDEGVHIGAGALLGDGEDNTPNQEAPERLNTGLTLVGLQAQIPAGARVGRNVAVRPRTAESAFGKGNTAESGSTV
jgi:glucose-1-phosphate adenylyltransferase